MDSRVYEIVVDDQPLSIHRSMEEATELADALPHDADVLIRMVATDPGLRGSATQECYRFDPVTRLWKRSP